MKEYFLDLKNISLSPTGYDSMWQLMVFSADHFHNAAILLTSILGIILNNIPLLNSSFTRGDWSSISPY